MTKYMRKHDTKLIATFGIVATVTGLGLLCANLAPMARYNGTLPLLYALPFIILYPAIGFLASRRRGSR